MMENTCNQISNKIKLNKSNEEEKTDKNTKVNQIKLYMDKKKKEKAEKSKLNFLSKQKFVEERKKKLAELHKTTLKLAKKANKKKSNRNECIMSQNVSAESNQPEVGQQSKKTLKIPINEQKKAIEDLDTTSYNDSNTRLNITKNDETIHLPIPEKMSECTTITPQTNLIEKNTVNIDTKMCTDIQLPNQSHKRIMNHTDQVKLQELSENKVLPNKTSCSESTQTEDFSIFKCKHNLPKNDDTKHITNMHLKCSKNGSIHRSSSDYSIDDHSISTEDNSKIILNTADSNNNKLRPDSKMNTLSSVIGDKTLIQTLEQLIQVEELRVKQHYTTLNLTENTLIKRLKLKVIMSELQAKNLYQPGHEKYLLAFKQKQRDDIKKLEHILSQVKRLGKVIDLIHKQQICLLKEHLQYLRTQSSFTNVFHKLESLNQIIKTEEYARKSFDFNLSKQCDKTEFINYIEKEHVNQNRYKCIATSKNNKSQTLIDLQNSNIVLRRYRGLVNQAMTCYLNSIIQALYMTPEFRNVLYQLKFDFNENTDESKSILFQLQKLFLNLQTSSRLSIETTELIRSFGWDSREIQQQRDVQEFRRFLFDALEQEFKNTIHVNIINELYKGKMIDYVKCLECGNEKSREIIFLEVHLPLRHFGSTNAYGCITEALQRLTQSEILYGNNKPFCERCSKTCNAQKRLTFRKFPYILTLHLMRIDYNTEYPIKLNDKVVFPLKLNLNDFISNHKNGQNKDDSLPEQFSEKLSGSSNMGVDINCGGTLSLDETDVNEGINFSLSKNRDKYRVDLNTENASVGPYVYELYALILHSGNALRGHYYAYIKDFKSEQWLCFDDQSVSLITIDDIERSFGGSGQSNTGTNAYMLMYRQIDLNKNRNAISQKEFPPHLKNLYNLIKKKAKDDLKVRKREQDRFKVPIYSADIMQCGDGAVNCVVMDP